MMPVDSGIQPAALRRVAALVVFALAMLAARPSASAQAVPPQSVPAAGEPEPTWELLAGDAREITHATSASRDTALLEAIVAPRLSVTLGGEFAMLAYRPGPVSLRAGLFALFSLESRTPTTQLFPAPGGDSDLWRGILGYELTCVFDRFAQRHLGDRGALELAFGYYHESEHHSASNHPVKPGEGPDHPELRGRPQISNFVMADLALRKVFFGELELVVREQNKLFTNGKPDAHEPFEYGFGGDLIVRYRHYTWMQPFSATFAELLTSPVLRDARSVRSLLGVAFPGRFGEVSVYTSIDAGAQKGLLIPVERTGFGGGVRYSPFGSY